MDRFADAHRLIGSPALDLPLHTWPRLSELIASFQPDLILELGRGYGNSTFVFTDAAHQVGSRVVSIGFDGDRAWETRTVPRLFGLVGEEWFEPLTVLHQDITTTDFRPLLAGSRRVVVFWDAHGNDVADAIIDRLLPFLPAANLVVVHDMQDVGHEPLPDTGDTVITAGPLTSIFEEVVPLWDYLERHDIGYRTVGEFWVAFTAASSRRRRLRARLALR